MKRHDYIGALLVCVAASACNRQSHEVMYASDRPAPVSDAHHVTETNTPSVYSEAEIGSAARAQRERATDGAQDADSAEYEKMELPAHRERRETASSSQTITTGRGMSTTDETSFGNPPGSYTGAGTTRAVTPAQGTASRSMEGPRVIDESPIGRAADVTQGSSPADRETTQRIRRAIRDDDSLSYTAKTVEVTTRDGNITLRGQVMSDKERWQVERITRGYAGSGKVDNYLSIRSRAVSTGTY